MPSRGSALYRGAPKRPNGTTGMPPVSLTRASVRVARQHAQSAQTGQPVVQKQFLRIPYEKAASAALSHICLAYFSLEEAEIVLHEIGKRHVLQRDAI